MAVNRTKVQQSAEKNLAAGKLDAAVADFQRLVSDNPRDLGTLNKIGDLYVRLNKKPDAINTYTRIAEIYAEDGFFLKAIAIYKKITKIDPSSIQIMTRLAELYSRQGLKTEARDQYTAVAQAHIKSGSPRLAIEAYEALAAIDPDSVPYRLALADLKAKAGLPSEAATTLLALGLDLERKGNAKESARVYELAFKTGQGSPEISERLATAFLSSGQHERALQIADRLLGSQPEGAPMMEVRALALEASGRPAEAEAAFRSCLEADPGRGGAVVGLCRVLASHGSDSDACDTLSSGMDAVISSGKGREATAVLSSILEREPGFMPALESLYRLQLMLGDGTATVATGRRLVEASIAAGHYSEALAVARRLTDLEPGVREHVDRLTRVQSLADGRSQPGEIPAGSVDLGPPVAGAAAEQDVESAPAAGARPEAAGVEGEVETAWEVDDIEGEEEDVVIDEGAVSGPEPGVEPVEALPAITPPAEEDLGPEDQEFIAERMTEADVFVKYGLADRAIEQLAAIAVKFPWHLSTRERLRDLYLEEGNRPRAAVEAAELGKIRLSHGDRATALAALDEARSIDPACPVIADLSAMLHGEAAPAMAPAAGEEEQEDEGLEAGWATEEAPVAAAALHAGPSDLSGAEEEEEDSVPMAAVPVSRSAADDDSDLAAALDASFLGGPGIEEGETVVSELEATPEAESLDDIKNAFKAEVSKLVGEEDFDTHYDLGIAYKEMGLIDDAIGEFQFASRSPQRLPSCCSMLGMCFREKGMHSIAVKWYRKGLDSLAQGEAAGQGTAQELLNGLRYDLAEVLDQMGELQQARDLLIEVFGADATYRDVAERMKDLEARLGR